MIWYGVVVMYGELEVLLVVKGLKKMIIIAKHKYEHSTQLYALTINASI